MKTKLAEIISAVTKAEGKKKSVSIGNTREIMRVIKTLCQEPQNLQALLQYIFDK